MNKILHVSLFKKMSPGQKKQLTYEYEYSKKNNLSWDTIAIVDELSGCDFEIQTPRFCRGFFRRKIYSWFWIRKNLKNRILLWRCTVDPFVILLGWSVDKYYAVHHAIDEHEIKMTRRNGIRRLLVLINYIEQKALRYQLQGRIGVTHEITSYYKTLDNNPKLQYLVMHNGISYEEYDICDDKRDISTVNIIFVASSFSDWHGLDRLLKSIEHTPPSTEWSLHIVGLLYSREDKWIKNLQHKGYQIKTYGLISNNKEMRKLLEKMDIGLSSFALDRKEMKQATTLKVREYLAAGLPVFSGHTDSAFCITYNKFYKEGKADINEIIKFGKDTKKINRNEVRDFSKNMIEKGAIMHQILDSVINNA